MMKNSIFFVLSMIPVKSDIAYFYPMKHLFFVLLFALSQAIAAQIPAWENHLHLDMAVLTADSMEGRLVGSPGEIKAAHFISDRMKAIGLKDKGSVGYYQYFNFTPHAAPHKIENDGKTTLGTGFVKEQTGRNVIGFWDRGFDQTIVIGAHYDHLGWGDENSLWSGEKRIHRGADDNASGVSALLYLAEALQKESPENLGPVNFLFIAFSGEEKGLYGSNYFSKNPTIPLTSISCMLNMDMIGRLKADRTLAINGTGTSSFWKKAIKKSNQKMGDQKFQLVLSESGTGPSDHTSFYNVGIPALHFFTGQHEQYHKPTDEIALIDFKGLQDIAQFILKIAEMAGQKGKLDFMKTKDEKSQQAANFKVTLGVMPDYLYSGEGLKIDGTKEGRPGAKAGLQQGDIILSMGKYPIADIYMYMDALSKFNPGDKTEIDILRNGKKMKLPVVFE